MAGNETDDTTTEPVVLGILEEAEHWQLQNSQFPSKVGGKPAWLCQSGLPCLPDLECEKCRLPTAFLMQVYAPIVGLDRSFHRTLFVFCCKTPACYSLNDNRCFKVYRSQLPRKNDFYPYEPPPDEEPTGNERDTDILESGIKLCRLCGCPGPKTCSRCHAVSYCCKEHQTLDWKTSHKNECRSDAPSSSAGRNNKFLFPEFELVTEPEELGLQDEQSETVEPVQKNPQCGSLESGILEEKELEDMAMHETEESKMFNKFKLRVALEPQQVLRYCRNGSPIWVSAKHIPKAEDIPNCACGAKRIFEFQIMPQLLNHLKVDSLDASVDWGTMAVYTCKNSCDQGNRYSPEFLWKQDLGGSCEMQPMANGSESGI